MAVPVIESSATNTSTLGYNTVTKPSGVSNGDVLIGCLFKEDNQTVAVPTGFTSAITRSTSEGDDGWCGICYKHITDASSEPSNYSWTWSGGEPSGAIIYRVSGVDTDDLTHATASGGDTSTEQDIDMVAITTTVDECLIIFVGGIWGFGLPSMTLGTYTAPTNWTKDFEWGNLSKNGIEGCTGHRELASAGTSPAATWSYTGSGADFDLHCLVALSPSAGIYVGKYVMQVF